MNSAHLVHVPFFEDFVFPPFLCFLMFSDLRPDLYNRTGPSQARHSMAHPLEIWVEVKISYDTYMLH
jgi:hypothetical protein